MNELKDLTNHHLRFKGFQGETTSPQRRRRLSPEEGRSAILPDRMKTQILLYIWLGTITEPALANYFSLMESKFQIPIIPVLHSSSGITVEVWLSDTVANYSKVPNQILQVIVMYSARRIMYMLSWHMSDLYNPEPKNMKSIPENLLHITAKSFYVTSIKLI